MQPSLQKRPPKRKKIESEVAALTANLDDLKTQLKAKKAELKAATKELAKAENKKLPPKQRQWKKQRRAKQKMC